MVQQALEVIVDASTDALKVSLWSIGGEDDADGGECCYSIYLVVT